MGKSLSMALAWCLGACNLLSIIIALSFYTALILYRLVSAYCLIDCC